jgi:hypothetical protein
VTSREGEQAVKMTRLSCHRFRSDEVRLWLSVIAYNLGTCGALSAAAEDRQVVTHQLAAAAGEDGRAIDQTRSVLLAALGGESSDTAVIYRDDAAD